MATSILNYDLVLLDDDHHTYDYVIEMLKAIFGYPLEICYAMACEVDEKKRVVVWTGQFEVAESYQQEIQQYGADWHMISSDGPMTAVLEQSL